MPILFRIIMVCCFVAGSIYLPAQKASVEISDTTFVRTGDSLSPLIVIGNIQITGNKKTKDYVIQREIPFKQGDNILRTDLPAKLELCRQQLMNTALFVDVEVKPKVIDNIILVEVHVKERWYLFPLPYFSIVARNFNDWLIEHNASLNRVNYGLKFTQNNVSGRNDNLNFWLISGYTQQASVRYENPFLDKTLKHGMSINVSYSRNREINYADSANKQLFTPNPEPFIYKDFHIELGYSYRPAIKTRHFFRVQYTDIEIDRSVLELNPKYYPENKSRVRFPGISYSIQYFNVDYIPYPLKGFLGDAYIFNRLSKDYMTQVGFKGTYTKEVFKKSYLQFQGAASIKLPFKQAYYSLGMFGSSDFYLRGLEPYVIQGVVGGFGRATVIKQALSFRIKNPIKSQSHDKIPFKFMLKAYGDLGYSYLPNPGNSRLNNKLLRTWGAGVDVLTIYDVVLKLEYSFNQLGEKGLFIHTATDF